MGLFGGSSETGYNCGEVNALRDVINQTAQDAGEEIVSTLYSDIVFPMSSVWYAPEAQTFFEGFAQTVANSGEAITEHFDTFRENVQSIGQSWAEKTGGEAPSLASIDKVELKLDVSSIEAKNEAGSVVINGDRARSIAGSLADVQATIETKLASLAAKLNADSAFIGQGQADALQNCFTKVNGEVSKIFSFLTDGEDSLQNSIEKAAQSYDTSAETVASTFNNYNA